jgi:hypothetical protein
MTVFDSHERQGLTTQDLAVPSQFRVAHDLAWNDSYVTSLRTSFERPTVVRIAKRLLWQDTAIVVKTEL